MLRRAGDYARRACRRRGRTLTEFSLTFTGKHVEDPSFPARLRHEGRFTASAPFCAAGSAVDTRDVQDGPLWVERTHTCDDGSGSIIVSMPNVTGEHGGNGFWQIIRGTGKYESLRGSGTYTGQRLSGDPGDFLSITYRTTWKGLVDFDTAPPALTLAATATKLKLPRRTYSVRVALVSTERGTGSPYHLLADRAIARTGRIRRIKTRLNDCWPCRISC